MRGVTAKLKSSRMEMPSNVLDALTTPAAYKVCRLLRASEFAKFGADRGLKVDEGRLRKLEQLGLFKPLLRIRQPDVTYKIETRDDETFRFLGELTDDEVWDGETRVELGSFGFYPHVVADWREHGLIWSPHDGLSPHDAEIDAERERHVAYYSEFQIWDLMDVVTDLTVRVSADNALDALGGLSGNHEDLEKNIAQIALDAVARRDQRRFRNAFALFAQLISDRYYSQTQSDGRQMTMSYDGTFHDWSWDAYASAWTPDETLAAFKLDKASSEWLHGQLCFERSVRNPLHAWRGLTRFVAVRERKRLKGDALLAETLAEMADMLRRFHSDAFGELLPDPDHTGFRRDAAAPPVGPDDPYRALELVVNSFRLNPKPQLVLIVEGQTEEVVLPEIFERWHGVTPMRYGIQLRNMHGVGNATGTKKDTLSALWRLVDFLHAQQTVALVLLDREGLAGRNIGTGLKSAPSIHFPDRMVTRKEYVKLWNRCFELDNFSDSEIAAAMTVLSGVTIRGPELKPCRVPPQKGVKAVTLERIFEARAGRPLNKVELARTLVEAMFATTTKRTPQSRPIIRFLEFAARTAALNHQPTMEDSWERNQRSGYLGALRPGAASRRKKRPT